MTNISSLTTTQQSLVKEKLCLVKQAIHSSIIVNETIFGFEYDDLFQEGCIWLCKAAATFREDKGVQFETYAYKVVVNGLRTYCRLMCNKNKHMITVPYAEASRSIVSFPQLSTGNELDLMISELDTMELLYSFKRQYTGTILRGIEAIEWKVKGYSGVEIAKMYGVKPNLVGAWISKAVKKLEQNRMFIIWRDSILTEKSSYKKYKIKTEEL